MVSGAGRDRRYVAVLVAVLILTLSPLVEAESDKGTKPRGNTTPHIDRSTVPDGDTEWAADPERGWVRAGEGPKARDQRHQADQTKIRKGRDSSPDKQRMMLQDY